MHDLLFEHQDALRPADLVGYADQLGLDVERFKHHLREHTGAHRVGGRRGRRLRGVSGTPTFFINRRRHYGAYDLAALLAAVRGGGTRASVARPPDSPSTSS
jgi:2-hydroxychromene-2-carboxylate isomerase